MRSLSLVGLVMVLLAGGGLRRPPPTRAAERATATFAGGCFWCMEGPFERVDGVLSATSGYSGGHPKNPTYEEVSSGATGHAESVQVVYEPARVSYDRLLEVFWHNIDPLARNAQFCDHGTQYRSAIFYSGEAQRAAAEASRARVQALPGLRDRKIETQIVPLSAFYPAEEYHQDYYKKNPIRYKFYRRGCGRDARLAELWGEGR